MIVVVIDKNKTPIAVMEVPNSCRGRAWEPGDQLVLAPNKRMDYEFIHREKPLDPLTRFPTVVIGPHRPPETGWDDLEFENVFPFVWEIIHGEPEDLDNNELVLLPAQVEALGRETKNKGAGRVIDGLMRLNRAPEYDINKELWRP